jgi:hyaluronan synthase
MAVDRCEVGPRLVGRDLEESLRAPGDWLLYGALLVGWLILWRVHAHHVLLGAVAAAAQAHPWIHVLIPPSLLWLAMGTLLLLFRTLMWIRYRPFPPVDFCTAPPLTVVIPAYNEGPMVLQAIASVVRARYPRDRLEIFAVDDGSRDDTWNYIAEAARRWPELVRPIRFRKNRGKRAALAAAFRRGRGEIFVTIDSDSVLEPEALLAIAGPFRDPAVGAVAGKVGAYNRRRGWLPRMLHVRYILSFDVLRASESAFGTVYCCPGALSAYRASAVRRVLPRWLRQTFLGCPCTYGEDRALTNYIFELGYHAVYQRAAVVHTLVPEDYRQLCRMFLRWDRSYVREELRFLKVVGKRPPLYRFLALWDRLVTNLRYPVNYGTLLLVLLLARQDPMTVLRFLVAVGLVSTLYALYYLRSERSLDFLYGVAYAYFSLFALTWIFPYAALTVRARGWLTR